MCTKKYNLWCMVPEIQTKSFCHFGSFFALLPPPLMILNIKILKKMAGYIILLHVHAYHKWRSYDIWFLKYKVWQTEMFDILGHFLPLQPIGNLENQNFIIEKKAPRDIIILHICTINDNHMMYGSWDKEHNRHNFLSFWTVFCPFTPLTTRKIKNLQISSFYTSVPEIMIICYTVP